MGCICVGGSLEGIAAMLIKRHIKSMKRAFKIDCEMLSTETEKSSVSAQIDELRGGEMKRNAFSKLIPVVCRPGVEES